MKKERKVSNDKDIKFEELQPQSLIKMSVVIFMPCY